MGRWSFTHWTVWGWEDGTPGVEGLREGVGGGDHDADAAAAVHLQRQEAVVLPVGDVRRDDPLVVGDPDAVAHAQLAQEVQVAGVEGGTATGEETEHWRAREGRTGRKRGGGEEVAGGGAGANQH